MENTSDIDIGIDIDIDIGMLDTYPRCSMKLSTSKKFFGLTCCIESSDTHFLAGFLHGLSFYLEIRSNIFD
jgi:hypothetical protein